MTENLKTEINEFILNGALKKEPVFDAFKRLCKLQDDPNDDYVDFERRYYQFYHGTRDLTIQKSPENSSPVSFVDLPIDVLRKVVVQLNLFDCLTLRKVSRGLRDLVNCAEIHCEKVEFSFKTHASADIESRKMSIADAYFLKNPKLKIDHITVCVGKNDSFSELLEFLKSLNFQLDVRSIVIDTEQDDVPPILQFLKPKRLEEILLHVASVFSTEQFDEIAETEQWKKAKTLKLVGIPATFRMEALLHFKRIHVREIEPSDVNLTMVRDILLKSAHFDSCFLSTARFEDGDFWHRHWRRQRYPHRRGFMDEESEIERRVFRIMSEDPAFNPETRRFSIPNSHFCFHLEYERDLVGLMITKVLGI